MSFLEAAGLYPLKPIKAVDGDWEVVGDHSNIVHINLEPGQEVQLEPGAMIYSSDGVDAKVRMGGLSRIILEGQFVKVVYKNNTQKPGFVGISSNFPGTVIPFNLSTLNNQIMCKHEAFLGSMDPQTKIGMTRLNAQNCCACCCSGMPMVMERIQTDKWIFLAAHGTIMQKQLSKGEKIIVDSRSVVAVSSEVEVDVTRAGSCAAICCGGEGIYNTALSGPGLVVLTSMSIAKIRNIFTEHQEKEQMKNNASSTD